MIAPQENESRISFARKKYRIDDLTSIEMAGPNGKPVGPGPVVAPETFQKFLDLDPSRDHKYLDWMLFQAGGGQEIMEKSLSLWDGDGPADSQSLKNQCRADFIDERVRGYTDENGTKHPPIPQAQAEKLWDAWEPQCQFEFVMGDQDVAFEDGFGFFRHWPGKEAIYQKVVNVVRMFHVGLPKLAANNEKFERANQLAEVKQALWSAEEAKFMEAFKLAPINRHIELDIYKGWKPNSYSQAGAIYKNLDDLLGAVENLRKMKVLSDVRFETVYEDANVVAVAPLTVGASLRHGSLKWCTSNKTDFERSFETRVTTNHNWKSYSARGPLVYLTFKVPMPDYLAKVGIHIESQKLKQMTYPFENIVFVDNLNHTSGTSFKSVCERIEQHHTEIATTVPASESTDELNFRYGQRKPGERAWTTESRGREVLKSFTQCLDAIAIWAKTFDPKKIVSDHMCDASFDLADGVGDSDKNSF